MFGIGAYSARGVEEGMTVLGRVEKVGKLCDCVLRCFFNAVVVVW